MQEDSTVDIRPEQEGEFWRTTWEFVVTTPSEQRHYPIHRSVVLLDFGDEQPHLQFHWLKGHLIFANLRKSVPLVHRRAPSVGGELEVGESLSWGPGWTLRLHDRANQNRATLECYSDPFYARIWPIEPTTSQIGRAGRRANQVILAHPTISREHATLAWEGSEVLVTCDSSSALVLVDGEQVQPGQPAPVQDGAMLQLGALLFQFRLLPPSFVPASNGKIHLQSLGTFQVKLGDKLLVEKVWRTQSMRWLLARLGLEWGRPLAVELLLNEFWPEKKEASARNNLNFNLSSLRQLFRSKAMVADPFLRGAGSVQLHPDLLEEHDVVRFRDTLAQAGQVIRDSPLQGLKLYERALALYTGPYLPGCYMEWAQLVRERLEQEVLQAGRAAIQGCLDQKMYHQIQSLAPKLLAIDPCCTATHSVLLSLEAHSAADLARLYKTYCQAMEEQLSLPPDPQVTRVYENALTQKT
ncbi:FHA domain-containing protein [bacterium]|nr:FHA domain-containing protein [bacterium]